MLAITIKLPGYKIAFQQQKIAHRNVLPSNNVILPAFYPAVLMVSRKFSIHFHPLRVPGTRGRVIFCQ
nr:MAG TPA: hypothetical protein [Caudoviricetes sp.]